MSYVKFSSPASAFLGAMIGLALTLGAPGQALAERPQSSPAQTQNQPQSPAQESTQPAAQPSLGEVARRLRAEQKQNQNQPVRVFTNDNVPKAGNLSIVGPPPSEDEKDDKTTSGNAQHEKHGAQYFRARMAELQQQLTTHQAELAVLQQRLGQTQVQYYPNPNETLQQEYSRADIDKLTQAINQKKQQIESDQQAISDLQDELRREGGDPKWLQGAQSPESAVPAKPDLTGVKKNSEPYWRLRFSAARKALAQAQTQQKVAEDELALLQSQQARDVASPNAPALADQVAAKQAEVESKRAATAQAQQDLDALEQEFKQSGAPDEWGQPQEASTENPSPQ